LFLFTYAQWAWAQSTGSAFWNSTISTPDVWYEVKYELDIDNATAIIGAAKVGSTMTTKEKTTSGGDFASLEFTIGKQHNSWTEYGTSGDIVYWIDDIKVSVTGVNVLSTSVDGIEENVLVDKKITVTLDEAVPDNKLTSDIFILKSADITLSANIKKVSDKVIEIEPTEGLQYNKD